jgi:hypothetical protein
MSAKLAETLAQNEVTVGYSKDVMYQLILHAAY